MTVTAIPATTRYRPVQVLQSGAEGSSLLLAQDSFSGSLVALKLLDRSQVSVERQACKQVLNRLRLSHPHLVELKEVFLTKELLVLVSEYAPGGSLAERIPLGGLAEDDARWLFQQALFSLEYTHRMGVASCGVTLDNLMVCQDGAHPIIKLDFGLSMQGGHTGGINHPQYLAPEQITNLSGKPYDAKKLDVWTCGIMLCILLTGRSPFQRDEDALLDYKGQLRAMLQRMLLIDYQLPLGISKACQDLIRSMLHPDPRKRPTVQELLLHTWCGAGLQSASMLHYNDDCFARSLAGLRSSNQVVGNVRRLMKEARMLPSSWTAEGLMLIPEEDGEW